MCVAHQKTEDVNMRRWIVCIMAALLALTALTGCGKGDTVKAEIVIKDYGTISLDLYPDVAPITVDNFVKLVNEGFYDGLTFHRIITDFMMQGGAGQGATTIKGEFSLNGVENELKHTRGVISMARSNAYNSASSQFFICQVDCEWLDGAYAAFGEVTEGMDIVDRICNYIPVVDNNGTVVADKQPVIETIRIVG